MRMVHYSVNDTGKLGKFRVLIPGVESKTFRVCLTNVYDSIKLLPVQETKHKQF